jgi:hypothetical protein
MSEREQIEEARRATDEVLGADAADATPPGASS